MPWRRNVLARGKQQRRARNRQTQHDGQIGSCPVGLRLRGINLMQIRCRPAAAMRCRHLRRAATAAHLLAASAFGGRHPGSGKRTGHGRRKKRHQRKENRPNSRDGVHCYQRSESRPAPASAAIGPPNLLPRANFQYTGEHLSGENRGAPLQICPEIKCLKL